jgi:tetraacyldisaccharide 4'-kinase
MLIVTRWLWAGRSVGARLLRFFLIPPALLYRFISAARAKAYGAGLLPSEIPPVPTVAVGNLTVGGSGKTPIATWIAQYYAAKGIRPGIVLRGYGRDEGDVHRALVPDAVVVENADRLAAAHEAVARGAAVLVLDDAFQRLDVGRDLNIAVVSAESSRAVRWTLPAGPWREGWNAVRRADLIIVTRKRAGRDAAMRVTQLAHETAPRAHLAVARLGIVGFRGLLSGEHLAPCDVGRARVLVSAGIGDPDSFAAQCEELGARVRLLPFPDHHWYGERDVQRLRNAARDVDYFVITEKDAVKLRPLWPEGVPEPFVSRLDIIWEHGRRAVERALDAAVVDVAELLETS